MSFAARRNHWRRVFQCHSMKTFKWITRLRHKIERVFLAGLLVTVPTLISFFLLRFFVDYIDRVSAPVVKRFLHVQIPGIGFCATVLLIFAAGFVGTNIFGKRLVAFGEYLLSKIPLVRSIYTSAKQVIEKAAFATEKPFKQVVLVPYPRHGFYVIGLLAQKVSPDVLTKNSKPQMLAVFIPSSPNFTSGVLVMYPHHDVLPLSMSVEDGCKYVMTGGMLVPQKRDEFEKLRNLEEWELFLY